MPPRKPTSHLVTTPFALMVVVDNMVLSFITRQDHRGYLRPCANDDGINGGGIGGMLNVDMTLMRRYARKEESKLSHTVVKVAKSNNIPFATKNRNDSYFCKTSSYANVVKASDNGEFKDVGDSHHSVSLQMENSNEFPLAILGCYNDFRAIAHTRSMCRSEGFLDVQFKYLGGLWVLFEFSSQNAKDNFIKHEGILSRFSSLKPWHDDFVVEERLIWQEIEGVPLRAWNKETHLLFWGDDSVTDDEDFMGKYEADKAEFFKNKDVESAVGLANDIGDENIYVNNDQVHDECAHGEEPLDSDPFELDSPIKKRGGKDTKEKCFVTPDFPPGFSPNSHKNQKGSVSCNKQEDDVSREHLGFSLVERLVETIKVGLALGLNMEGCENTLASLIAGNGEIIETKVLHVDLWMLRQVWGNSHFDFASTSARGMSGGIICIWNSLLFCKSRIVCNENYVVVEGLWIPNDVRLMWIVVYSPQNMPSKIALWSSLTNIISNWDGNLIVMGDFNEVREAGERYGSIFNERQAEIFNEFISNSALIDIPLGGFSFTWTDKWGSKMSKLDQFLVSNSFYEVFSHVPGVILEKGIPDHRPILLKEFVTDYGPTTFRFFNSWLDMKGFHDLVSQTWHHDGIVEACGFTSLKKKLHNLKGVIRVCVASKKSESSMIKRDHESRLASIDAKVDQGCANEEDFINRTFPKGCNSLFIALILKVIDAKFVSDFWPISLIGCQYKIIGKLLANRLSSVIGDVISPEQSAFIKGRNIFDGPLIINEVMDWYRKRKKDLMIFKVDFEKAFDSLRWDFLDLVMENLGFGHKWRSWIYDCLHNAQSLVLVNGSPTTEFKVFRGLRQGDPLSSFLFILAMEEDVIFIGEWSWQNTHNLLCMLRCFYLISGLKINVNKSNIFGVSVSDERVSNMANSVSCGAGIFPMKYLGVPVGCNMTRCASWSVIIKKFSSKLASWKAQLLSVGGRLSLIKSVLGHLPTYYIEKMTWVRWNKCLASKDLGGLGIGSIFGLNIGLLFKWIWRFFHYSSDLWARVIKNIYGPCGGINDTPGNHLSHSTWGGILSSIKRIKQKGIDLLSYCVRKIGDGTSTRFWEDTWCGDQPLKITFPRIYQLDTDKDCFIINRISLQDLCSSFRRQPRGGAEMAQFLKLQAKIENVVLSDQGDTWKWSLGSATCFLVASVRYLIDSKTLDTAPNATRWLRNIPIKVNIFIWRLMLNKLPSKVNLDKKGIDVGLILCPICQKDVKTINYIFFLAIWL
ncbi:RNA-directed DNA polymerase, eukaryota, reverse transcriptase zinc-binding domain protein [Tanacetum coccineum]